MFPLYLALGMTPRQYWYGDPYLTVAYRKADELKRKRKNETLWMQGLYVYDAFSVTMANAFKKKGARPAEYPKKPYDVTEKSKEEKEAACKAEQDRIRQSLENMRLSWIQKEKEKAAIP